MKGTPSQRLAKVRRLMVTAFWKGTGTEELQWWACHICSWTWKEGDKELHEPTCPLGGEQL